MLHNSAMKKTALRYCKVSKANLFLCNFSVRTLQCFQRKILFFCPQKVEKPPSKVAHNPPQTFFSCTGSDAQTSPELIFHVINMSQDASVLLYMLATLLQPFHSFNSLLITHSIYFSLRAKTSIRKDSIFW